jgi:CubicO group peptidase (beta-lactamase class C family)
MLRRAAAPKGLSTARRDRRPGGRNARRVGTGREGDHGRPLRIGNITETLETTLLLKLVEQGRLRLDDPISKWFPDLPQADQVTVAMLVPAGRRTSRSAARAPC